MTGLQHQVWLTLSVNGIRSCDICSSMTGFGQTIFKIHPWGWNPSIFRWNSFWRLNYISCDGHMTSLFIHQLVNDFACFQLEASKTCSRYISGPPFGWQVSTLCSVTWNCRVMRLLHCFELSELLTLIPSVMFWFLSSHNRTERSPPVLVMRGIFDSLGLIDF